MSVGGGGGGYSGGGGGFSGGFAPPPMFGGGFGQQFPSYGGGFGAFGPQPYSGFGGGFGGGFGMPQQPQYGGGFGGGFGMSQPQYGGFQQPQYGGGFGLMPPPRPSGVSDQSTGEITFGVVQPPQFGGGFGQRGPGNAYARPFPGLQPQPAPPPQQLTPPPGMELNPDYRPRDVPPGMFTTMEIRPNENRFRPIQARAAVEPETPTGGGYPSRDQFYGQPMAPTVIQPIQAQQSTAYVPSAEKQQVDEIMKRSFNNPSSITAEDRAVLQRWDDGASARSAQDMQAQMQAFRQQQQLAGGLGGTYGGYQAMPFGGYRMFPF